MPECKTSDVEEGRAHWLKFHGAIAFWRTKKKHIFENGQFTEIAPEIIIDKNPKGLRDELKRVRTELNTVNDQLAAFVKIHGPQIPTKLELEEHDTGRVIEIIKRWSKSYKIEVLESKSAPSVKEFVDLRDFEI